MIIVACIGCLLAIECCQREPGMTDTQKPLFDSLPIVNIVQPQINEASGIAASKKNAGHLWVQQDGGNPAELFLLHQDGSVRKKTFIKGIANRDWEDMAISGNDIYIGEIGDNNLAYSEYTIYKLPEPMAGTDTVFTVEAIRFRYPDGAHDAEAFVVDPQTNAIYIFTKRDLLSGIYKLTPPFSLTRVNLAEKVGQLPYSGVVGAAISSDGKEVIIKTYFELGYYKLLDNETIEAALSKPPQSIPYRPEPQGEAVCFSATNNGYFTLSEKGFAPEVKLYFYKRK